MRKLFVLAGLLAASLGAEPVDILTEQLMLWNIDGTIGGKRPALYPQNQEALKLRADFLYLTADEDGLSYAWTFPEAFPAVPGDLARRGPLPGGTEHDLSSHWDPGFRLAAGYRFENRGWDLALLWTYCHNRSTGAASIPNLGGRTLIATWFPAGFLGAEYMALNASVKWTLNLNVFDLGLSRATFATEDLVISPSLSLRGVFLHQHFVTLYSQGRFFNQVGTNIPAVGTSAKCAFDGLGIRPGINLMWFFTGTLSLYADGAVSLLYGRFKTSQKAHMARGGPKTFLDTRDRFFQNAFEIDCGAGVRWDRFFKGRRHVSLSLGYEMMSWFDQNQLVNYSFADQVPGAGQPAQGDLGIQGVNGSIRFDF